MLQYPSIIGPAKAPIGKQCVAFVKYDGSNLRWEWSPKAGWNKFGTRRQLFDASTPIYNQAIPIFMEQLADEIVYRTKQLVKKPERITAFTEFFGPQSFAGAHELDDPKELRLFDVFLFKKGLVPPRQFVKTYGDLPRAAEVIYEGNLNRQFIMDVREGRFPVVEGVIAKGEDFMVKIKTKAYFDRLFNRFGDDWEKYGE
jgi:hypothetical protein